MKYVIQLLFSLERKALDENNFDLYKQVKAIIKNII